MKISENICIGEARSKKKSRKGRRKNMESVKIWEEQIVLPTYEVGEADKNPMFLKAVFIRGAAERSIRIRRLRVSLIQKQTSLIRRYGWKMNI